MNTKKEILASRLVETYVSGDYTGHSMATVLDAMEDNWKRVQQEDEFALSHRGERAYGGPVPYIRYLANVMRKQGWIGKPVTVNTSFTVLDGHHRVLAAYIAGLKEVPCNEISG